MKTYIRLAFYFLLVVVSAISAAEPERSVANISLNNAPVHTYTSAEIQRIFRFKSEPASYLTRLSECANLLAAQEDLSRVLRMGLLMNTASQSFPEAPCDPSDTGIQLQKKQFLFDLTRLNAIPATAEGMAYVLQICQDFISTVVFKADVVELEKRLREYEKIDHPEVQKIVRVLDSMRLKSRIMVELSNAVREAFIFNDAVETLLKDKSTFTTPEMIQALTPLIFLSKQSNTNAKESENERKIIPKEDVKSFMERRFQECFEQFSVREVCEDKDLQQKHENERLFIDFYLLARAHARALYNPVMQELRSILYENIGKGKAKGAFQYYLTKIYNPEKPSLPLSLPENTPCFTESHQDLMPLLKETIHEIFIKDPAAAQTWYGISIAEIDAEKEAVKNSAQKKKKTKQKKNKEPGTFKEQLQFLDSSPASVANAPLLLSPAAQRSSWHAPIHTIFDKRFSANLAIYLAMRHNNKIGSFAWHPRLYKWFGEDVERTLERQGYNDPASPKYALRETAEMYHGFSMDVDPFVRQWGTCYQETSNKGQDVLFIAIPGHIEKDGKYTFGFFGYAYDIKKKEFYHRCFEQRPTKSLIEEHLLDNHWKVTLDAFIEKEPK